MSKKNIEGGVIHQIHHKTEEKNNNIEVTINSGTFTGILNNNDSEENIEFLLNKALCILEKLKQETQ